jgi:hypothetical protein
MSDRALVTREQSGRWLPGVSGNPGGRPAVVREVVELARQHTREAVATLVEIAVDKKQHGMARVRAAEILLNRGHGSVVPERDLAVDGFDGERIVVKFRIGDDRGGSAGLVEAEELEPET